MGHVVMVRHGNCSKILLYVNGMWGLVSSYITTSVAIYS